MVDGAVTARNRLSTHQGIMHARSVVGCNSVETVSNFICKLIHRVVTGYSTSPTFSPYRTQFRRYHHLEGM